MMQLPKSPRELPELTQIRARIDELDTELLDLMLARLRLATATLAIKESSGLLPVDIGREAAVVSRGARLARERGLDPELVRDIFWRLIELSRTAHPGRSKEPIVSVQSRVP